jgi:hypothetical protein
LEGDDKQMKIYFLTILVLSLFLSACGQFDRDMASMTGSATKTCVDGVTYLQFTSGATVQLDITGKPVACK